MSRRPCSGRTSYGGIAAQTGGSIDQWTVRAPWGTLFILPNREWDPQRQGSAADGFRFYRYSMHVHPTEDGTPRTAIADLVRKVNFPLMDVPPADIASPEAYIDGLKRLVQSLADKGWKVGATYAED